MAAVLTTVTILARVGDSEVLNEIATVEIEAEWEVLAEPNEAGATRRTKVDIEGILQMAIIEYAERRSADG